MLEVGHAMGTTMVDLFRNEHKYLVGAILGYCIHGCVCMCVNNSDKQLGKCAIVFFCCCLLFFLL